MLHNNFAYVWLIIISAYRITLTDASDYVTLGNRFIFGFLEGGFRPHLYVTTQSQTPVWVNVSVPSLTYLNRFTVKADSHISIDLPSDVSLEGIGKSDRVVLVEAESFVSVYGITKSGSRIGEGFTVIPVSHLGTEHYIASGMPDSAYNEVSQIGIFAPYDNTSVSVFTETSIHNITLNNHEAFQLKDTADLSGTYIYSNNPVSILAGVASLSAVSGSSRHLTEQIPDVTSLGREYVLSPLFRGHDESGYTYRIVATEPDTKVDIVGTDASSLVLQAGQVYYGNEVGTNTTMILADRAVLVVQLIQNNIMGTINGTFMTVIPSIQMFHEDISFFVPQSDSSDTYISITARCSDGDMLYTSIRNADDVRYDSLHQEQLWDAQYTSGQFCMYQKQVSSGTYRVSVAYSVHARFFVLLYGGSDHLSYAFPVAFDKERDACSSNPCLNGATCFNRQSRYDFLCLCQPGWEGRNCHLAPPPDVCENVTCHNGGRCFALGKQEIVRDPHTCLCTFGWGGPDCNEDIIDECKLNRSNCGVGTCVDGRGTHTCNCPPTYSGDHCEMVAYQGNPDRPSPTEVITTAGVLVGCLCLIAVIINVAFITRERCSIRRHRRRRNNSGNIEQLRTADSTSRRHRRSRGRENETHTNEGMEDDETAT